MSYIPNNNLQIVHKQMVHESLERARHRAMLRGARKASEPARKARASLFLKIGRLSLFAWLIASRKRVHIAECENTPAAKARPVEACC